MDFLYYILFFKTWLCYTEKRITNTIFTHTNRSIIMEKKNVVIHIAGSEYTILTEEDPAYVEALAETLDKDITEIVGANRRLSMTQAAILAALDYADKAAKESEAADNLRGQIKEYLEDSARYKMEAEVARRDVERLQKELKNAKSKPF